MFADKKPENKKQRQSNAYGGDEVYKAFE